MRTAYGPLPIMAVAPVEVQPVRSPVSKPPLTMPSPPLGRKSVEIKDADGKPIGQMFQELATAEGSWVDYRWMNPKTNTPEKKSSWLIRAGGYIFGCGIYK